MWSNDPLSRILYIDLSRRSFSVENHPDLIEKWLGGVGIATQLLHEHCPKGADPLGPNNPIILAVGPLVGRFPLASKTVAMFKSPLTGNLGESHAGGRSAVAIRMAGYGAIVIQGTSTIPIYVVVDNDHVYFRDASALWGMHSSYTVGDVLRKQAPGSGHRTIMRIGRAGERLISYACVITETYRHFGRLGLGAVFGSKKLKALVVTGCRALPVENRKAYRKTYDQIYDNATHSPMMKKYHDLGTPMNIHPLNTIGALPTRNLQSGQFQEAETISGEYMAEHYLGRRLACSHCPVACIHLAALRIPHPKEPFFYKTSMLGYDYEPIFSLGTMLGIGQAPGLLQLMDEVEVQGLDAMSTGVALAWATEAQEKGLISIQETDGLVLNWGDWETYIKAVKKLVALSTDFYRALGKGVDHAASIYGGEDFALAFGGNEMPGYHTGPGAHLGYLTGARHSHLDSGGYSLDQKALTSGHELTAESVANALLQEERWRQILASLVICFFARKIYTPETICDALASSGFEITPNDLERLGKEILAQKYAFKRREGFDLTQIRIPKRIFETPSALGDVDETLMRQTLVIYDAQV